MGKQQTLLRESGARMLESIAAYAAAEPAPFPGTSARPPRLHGVSRMRNALEIPTDRIVPDPGQPRKSFPPESIDELALSLKERGQLQPILVRWVEELDRYKIIAGNRRHLAAGRAGLPTVLCVVVERDLTPAEVRALQLIENIHREDLRPLEKSRAFRDLMEENQWSQRELARVVHLDVATVNAALALLSLPEDIQELVDRGELTPSVASEIAKLPGEADRRELAGQVLAEKLTREQVRRKTRKPRGHSGEGPPVRERCTRTYNLTSGRVSVTLNQNPAGPEEILALVEELLTLLRRELGEGDGSVA